MKRIMAALFCVVMMALISDQGQAIEIDQPGGVDIHGFISQGFLESNANNFFADTKGGSFDLKDAGLTFSTDVSGRLRAGIQVLAYKMGDFGSDDIRINWANGDFSVNENLGVKVGKMKLQHGLFNATRDGDFLRTSILLPQSIYNEAWRSTVSAVSGIEFYGSFADTGLGRLSYNFQAGKNDIQVTSGVSVTNKEKLLEAGIDFDPSGVSSKTMYTGHLLWDTPVPGLSFNTTYWTVALSMNGTLYSVPVSGTKYTFSSPIADEEYDTQASSVTSSVEYIWANLHLVGEYSLCKYNFSMIKPQFVFNDKKLDTEGYYVSAAYRFKDWLESELYYSVYYPDKDDKSGSKIVPPISSYTSWYPSYTGWLKDTCLALRFDLLDNWVFKLEGHMMDGAAIMRHENNPIDGLKEHWALFGAKMTFSF